MSKRYDIMAPRKGRERTFWTRIGTAFEGDKGIQLIFDALPLPDAEGRCVAKMPSRLIRTADDLDALFTLLGNVKLPLTVDWVQGADRTAQQNKLMWRWATEAASSAAM
jgi:hypothetical protein